MSKEFVSVPRVWTSDDPSDQSKSVDVVSYSDYCAAQTELAALREELAHFKDGSQHLLKSLAAAEQRNAFLEAQVAAKDTGIDFRDALINEVEMSEDTALMAWVPSDWEAKRRTLLSNAKPTESGASE
jgi:hypothetical protein